MSETLSRCVRRTLRELHESLAFALLRAIGRTARQSVSYRLIIRLGKEAWESFFFSFIRELPDSAVLKLMTLHMPVTFGVAAGLIFIVPHELFDNRFSLAVMAGLTGLLLFGARLKRLNGFALHGLGWYALTFAATILLGMTSYPSLSLRFFLFTLTAFLGLLLTGSVLQTRRDITRFLLPVLAAVTVSGLYGCWQAVVGVEINASQIDVTINPDMPGRIFSFFDNPNNFAGIIVMTLPFFAGLFFMVSGWGKKIALLAAAGPIALSLLLTYSRSGWMAMALAVVVFFFFTYRWVVPVLFILGLAALPVLPDAMRQRLLSIFSGDSSMNYRTVIRDTLQPVLSQRWFFGAGLGSDAVRASQLEYYGARPELGVLWWQIAPHTHNLYLQLWAELGIAGAASFCGTMVTFFKKSASALFAAARKNFLAASGMAGIAGILLMGFGEYIWFYPRNQLLFWLIAGVTLSAIKASASEETASNAAPPACEGAE
jgi:O-antigen ligase